MNLKPDTSLKLENDKLNEIRIVLMRHMLNKGFIILLISLMMISTLFFSLELIGIVVVLNIMVYVFILYYPQIKEQNSYSDLNQELPYALRHMGIELKSGKGLHDSLITIRNGNYGSLSKEFNRVLEEIKFGKSTETSLLEMSHRVNSPRFSIAIQQIISTLRVGGNLSNSLNIIAKDITFDMQISLKEYSQKLNSFILIYTFIAILAPVISLVMLMASSTVIGDVVSSNLLFTIYTLFFPMIVVFMGILIKKLEPKI
ncbi:type II secretion system F family protein [Methanobrevibacter sp. YE315]|uniref:type II secretion system F family protein n=1 Tax=Methanobrevibacter sp. YE315 TaxID=1609968 RepID=UPI001E60AB59|nr:type II secretion system F family protein [Methanobrevibacter sp. YE315]